MKESNRTRWRHLALWLLLSGFANVAALHAQTVYQPSQQARVTIDQGTLQGAEPASGVFAYLGIPYAKPPVGEFRWQPPQTPDRWPGTRLAVRHGNPCPQQDSGWNKSSAQHGNEDCLFLNVWTSAHAEAWPVMVYIHGGSNVAGSAAEDLSNGLSLVPRGVVLVTLDYRLGIFGFFRTPELDRESPHRSSGDYGLLDQIAALQWVQRNIAKFGGDPNQVTIFGQSAGAVDTGLLLASPLAAHLFQGAIEESGQVLGLMPTATREESENAWSPVAKALGADLAAQRRASTAELLAANRQAPKPPPVQWWGLRGASIDGWVLPEAPWRTFAEGKEAPVPLVLGSNVQEIVPRDQSNEQLRHAIENTVGADDAAKLLAIYAQSNTDPLLGGSGARWATDHDFRCAVRQIATWHAVHGYPTFVYQFDRPAPGNQSAQHSSELFYVFNYFRSNQPSPEDRSVSDSIERYWTGFARAGTPEGPTPWPRFTVSEFGPYLHFPQQGTAPRLEENLGAQSCEVIQHAYPK